MRIETVLGLVDPVQLGITDAHNHIWIAALPGSQPGLPVLDDPSRIIAELGDYRRAGGGAIVDCQPGRCGRNGNRLRQLSQSSGVLVVGCTGFHRAMYYPGEAQPSLRVEAACQLFVRELTVGMEETLQEAQPVKAGFIKVACEATLGRTPLALLEAAACASLETGAAIQAHTEKGADAERIVDFFARKGVAANRLVICHLDKRPDFGLHRSLALAGCLLEYDTFFRPKYEPEKYLWPLLEQMLSAGLYGSVALATDIAAPVFWSHWGGSPGLAGFLTLILPRLKEIGANDDAIQHLMGHNIAQRLAR